MLLSNCPSVSYRMKNGSPIYSIKNNSQAYWWGLNTKTLGITAEQAGAILENQGFLLTSEEYDDFWDGFHNGH